MIIDLYILYVYPKSINENKEGKKFLKKNNLGNGVK